MRPEFTPDTDGYQSALLCPRCKGSMLHHFEVDIFERVEDQKCGLHANVTNNGVQITQDLTGNPSARRNGIAIKFFCEDCGSKSALSISQHKGSTYVDLVVDD